MRAMPIRRKMFSVWSAPRNSRRAVFSAWSVLKDYKWHGVGVESEEPTEWGVQLGPLGTAATNGLLCQPRVIMMMEKLVEGWLAGKTEVLGGNLPQCCFVHHKLHMLCQDVNSGRRGGKPATNRLSYGTAWQNVDTAVIRELELAVEFQGKSSVARSRPVKT
jgi:hypothetical protein